MGKALLALASCGFALLLAEGVVRLLPGELLGFVYRNGHFGRPREFAASGEDVARMGRHERPLAPKPAGVTRLVLLGDSYVQALSVSDAEAVGARLEQSLNTAAARGRFEVVAWGVGGWGPAEQLAFLRRRGPGAQPDWVVTLFLAWNDVRENEPALQSMHRQQDELVAVQLARGSLPGARTPLLLFEASALNRLLSFRLLGWMARRDLRTIPLDYLVYAVPEDPRWRAAWEKTEAVLLETRAVAAGLGARYAIASASTPHGVWGPKAGLERLQDAYPAMRALRWDLDHPDRRLGRFCAEHGIPFRALEPAFREAVRAGGRYHWRYDGHWNAAGNDLAGQLLAEWLLPLIDPGSAPQQLPAPRSPSG